MNQKTADRLDDRTPSLHHSEHREKGTALLIIDMISGFDHENGGNSHATPFPPPLTLHV